MTVITCPECGHRVSDQAAACPQCARPMRQAPTVIVDPYREPVQTIQRTSKKYKGFMLAGVLIFFVGCGMFVENVSTAGARPDPSNIVIAAAGIILFAWARVAAWWNHG